MRGNSKLSDGRKDAPHPLRASGAQHPLPASGERESSKPTIPDPESSKPAIADPAATLDPAALYKLMAWFSPAYPIGAFSYSSGIEWAVEAGDVTSAETLLDWLDVMLRDGAGFCDGVFFAQAWRASATNDDAALTVVAELAAALSPSRERFLETTAQGRAFVAATQAAWPCEAIDRLAALEDQPLAYPIAAGVATAGHAIPLAPALAAYLQALAANWVSAGVRLIPLGQSEGQRLIAALAPAVAATAARAIDAALDDLGNAAFRADLASMRHESQYTRLFRS